MVGTFDIYKRTGVIDGFDGEDINISGEKGWPSELTIQNCLNLKSVDCSDLIGLKKLENLSIINCPNLEFLNASNNEIRIIDLEIGNDKLETINLNDNELTTFSTSKLFNLKDLNVGCNKLTNLNLPDCDGLENLSANHNKLTELVLNGLINLESVYIPYNEIGEIYLEGCENLNLLNVSNNELEELDLYWVNNLNFLNCSYNAIQELEIRHLKELKTLSCEVNHLISLNCSKLEKLKCLHCFSNVFLGNHFLKTINGDYYHLLGLEELIIENCNSLEELDIGENSISFFELINHPNLITFSCKSNKIEQLSIQDCPKLKYLEFSRQGAKLWEKIIEKSFLLKGGEVSTDFYIDKNSCASLERATFTEGTKIFLLEGTNPVPFDWKEDFKYFPKLTDFGVGNIADDPAFEEWLDKQRQEEWERDNLNQLDEGYQSEENNNNTIPNCNYKIPEKKEKFEELNISHHHLKGKLIIEDWPNLKLLDVGDNRLSALVVINCPKLRKLIYAHNAMPNEAEIEKCPKLQEIDNYRYDEFVDREDEPISEEERAYIEEQERRERQREDEGYQSEEDDEINHEITLEYLESLTYEELFNLDPKSVPRDLAINVISLLKKKFIEQIKQQGREKEALKKLAGLIIEAQQALKENNLSKLKTILDEMKTYCDTDAYANNKEVITKLEQQLINATSQSEPNNKTPNLPLIIGFSIVTVSLGILGIIGKILVSKKRNFKQKYRLGR